jgi:hypothetical protein
LTQTNINTLFTLIDEEFYKEKMIDVAIEETVWFIGTSQKSCSVAEAGVLRAIEFTEFLNKPDVEHILLTVLKAIVEPLDSTLKVVKPAYIVFLDTVSQTKKDKTLIGKRLEEYGIKLTTANSLRVTKPDLFKLKIPVNTPVKESIPYNPQPKRGCFNCRTEIEGKASQCSACKAVIYCSVECAVLN